MPRIEELYAYISHEPNDPDDEGVCAFMASNGWMPMVGADEARMTSLREKAQQLVNASGNTITLVKFSTKTVLETIEPE